MASFRRPLRGLSPLHVLVVLTALCPNHSLAATSSTKVWQEQDLRPYTDVEEPPGSILIGLNRTVYNVSSSPRFYGPGGPYHHFTGRDASRAWVTECWDDEDQLTWRMDGVEEMFMPRYLDEFMDDLVSGKEVDGMASLGDMGLYKEQFVQVAKASVEKVGGVSKKKRAQRREEDVVEAREKVDSALKHWVDFFEEKYDVVGTIEYDEDGTPVPPPICEQAMQKRPVKGGKLESLMQAAGAMMGGGSADDDNASAEMPDFVREKVLQKKDAADSSEADQRDEL